MMFQNTEKITIPFDMLSPHHIKKEYSLPYFAIQKNASEKWDMVTKRGGAASM